MGELGAALTLTYAWLKAGHVIFVIFWIAGLFMLPRFYVYHQEAAPGSDEEQKWIDRERKLRNIIITPAILLVWVFGLSLAWVTGAWSEGWFHAKFALVLALSGYHGWMVGYGRKLASGARPISGRTLRMMNEIPGIAVVLIVVLVIVRPF
ncbi:CopD family protein [Sphingosinicella sp. CPCC 101087]|uniref:CopD family protein n=1 Tax=Sphingosinicella sp. CPCC 101087 TaxID=2497754 RepID=UPI00101C6304|nr:CopD family protein [Sphingosinicella sp. CPCC 101087]